MRNIFLDVGAYIGNMTQTALEYDFDELHCFEPATTLLPTLKSKFDHLTRVKIHPFGLWDCDVTKTLYSSGSASASVFADKIVRSAHVVDTPVDESIELIGTSDWCYDNLEPDDRLFIKLNCEGAEVNIIDDLLESDWINNVIALAVEFDCIKIPGMEYMRLSTIQKLHEAGMLYKLRDFTLFKEDDPEDLGARVHRWLSGVPRL